MSWNKKPRQDLADEPEQTLKAALRYLGRREYTAKELAQRLSQRGAMEEDIAAALAYVQERGFQDDTRAGEIHIRQRLNFSPRGRGLVRQELRQRGLSSELAENLLNEHYPPEMEREVMQKVLRRQDAKNWQKAARSLAAKGFSSELITEELAHEFWE